MARSRRTNCGHGDNDPVYPVFTQDGYEPADPEAVDAALQHLADVLNALPGPFEGALADLTPRDIATLISRAPLEVRGHALRALGLRMVPRTVGQALCRDVLTRLHRVHLHDAMHAASVMTGSVRGGLRAATKAWAGAHNDMAAGTVVEVADWPDALWRFGLWASVAATVADARMLLWAGIQPWWLPQGVSQAHGDAVLAAAWTAGAGTRRSTAATSRARTPPRRREPTRTPARTAQSTTSSPSR